jgi:hypothetical protein
MLAQDAVLQSSVSVMAVHRICRRLNRTPTFTLVRLTIIPSTCLPLKRSGACIIGSAPRCRWGKTHRLRKKSSAGSGYTATLRQLSQAPAINADDRRDRSCSGND